MNDASCFLTFRHNMKMTLKVGDAIDWEGGDRETAFILSHSQPDHYANTEQTIPAKSAYAEFMLIIYKVV